MSDGGWSIDDGRWTIVDERRVMIGVVEAGSMKLPEKEPNDDQRGLRTGLIRQKVTGTGNWENRRQINGLRGLPRKVTGSYREFPYVF